jgi:hypothetical protein
VLCASRCQCSTGVERRATSGGGKMVGRRRHKALAHIPGGPRGGGGFTLLEIKLQALLDCSTVLALREGDASLCSAAAYRGVWGWLGNGC